MPLLTVANVCDNFWNHSLAYILYPGSVNLVFDNLGFLDFRTSNAGILLINEAELIAGNCYKKRIVSLAKVNLNCT